MSHASVLVALDPTVDVEAAIEYQMLPFDEAGEWFADGSRWDWWQVGGRYTGLLLGYDPEADLRNVEVCDLCAGTGTRRDMTVTHGCNGCQGKGTRLKWPTQWVQEGNIVRHGELAAEKRNGGFPAHYAFLRNRVWHETARLGWWGGRAATECEVAGRDVHICTHDKDGARIISWGDSNSWDTMFYPRFVAPLSPDTLLVTVDFHV